MFETMIVLDTTYIHIINAILSLIAILISFLTLKKIKEKSFAITMILLSIVFMINVFGFFVVYFIDRLDKFVYDPIFYNLWSLFIRTQSCVTILWISILGYRRIISKQ